ncbi:nodulation receptor kinase-like [Vitis riparia]|uniref:nodulation receptor kinase-like n=1 Tax=Vitis riparia TaxID=96939 RepID=UPI00155B1D5B|nr:nodulation receptor kinase-like [Vitis riparia]
MDESILHTHKWQRTKCLKLLFVVYIFIVIGAVNFAVCHPSASDCILDFQSLSSSSSSCEEGDWGSFLNKGCCGAAFGGYLYSLGKHANETGKVYLNSTEQRNCLTSMKRFEADAVSCGIEKLTSGTGGCSDFSVFDVTEKLGDEFRSLEENCKFVSPDGEWDQSCSSCVTSWEDIRGMHSTLKDETDVCRFAVLVSLISSRTEDESWFGKIYTCLREQDIDKGHFHFQSNTRSSGQDETSRSHTKFKISTGLWFLIGGLIAMALIIAIGIWFLLRRWCKSYAIPKRAALKAVAPEGPGCMKISIKEVYSATNNLNEKNIIGEGTAGKVYRGILQNNQHVAVKHIINDNHMETFVREITSLSHIKHPNLVALLGYCEVEDECFLVYELCPNGNLSEWLFGKDKVLSWIQRLEIAIDSAQGLLFLHTYPAGCIVHRDIKPTNILLGANFEAKLSDFGLSKVIDQGESHVSSEVRGTFGYMDPEYQSNHHVNPSGDVYSFGIVLLQILSGKKVINLNLKKPMSLDKMAKILTKDGSITEFVDPKLDGEYSAEAFDLILKLALSCTSLKQQRPSMEQVVLRLEKALDISTMAKACTPQLTPNRLSSGEKKFLDEIHCYNNILFDST